MNYLIRVAIISFVVFIVWSIVRRAAQQEAEEQRPVPKLTPEVKQSKMLRCDECGVHFPQEESVQVGKKIFCCEEHKKQALQRLSD
jgi:uncharacterized protein